MTALSMFGTRSFVSLFVFALILPFAQGCRKADSAPPPPKPPEVLFIVPNERSYQESEEFTGRLWAIDTIEIRARVSGYLDRVSFKDGALVKQGDPLFQIDPRTYENEVLRTTSAVSQLKSRLQRLESQLTRSERLLASNAVSKEEVELLQFDRDEADANLHAAEAAQKNARLNVEFASIKAPISGKISRRLVDPGNLVQADTTALAHLVSLDPLYAYFDMDERTLLKIRRMDDARMGPVNVTLSLADQNDFSIPGRVDFEDNQLDASTGTLRMRAKVENPQDLLSPGMFVRCRYPIGGEKTGLFVPEECLGSDQGQSFLYVIGAENKIEYRRVKIGALVNGKRVIRENLKPGERVVVSGLQRVRPGIVVAAKPAKPDQNDSGKSSPGESVKPLPDTMPQGKAPAPEKVSPAVVK